jgi:hypothetical protein
MQTRSTCTTLIRLPAIPIILHHHTAWPGILIVGVSTAFANGTGVRISTLLQCYKPYLNKMHSAYGCWVLSLLVAKIEETLLQVKHPTIGKYD